MLSISSAIPSAFSSALNMFWMLSFISNCLSCSWNYVNWKKIYDRFVTLGHGRAEGRMWTLWCGVLAVTWIADITLRLLFPPSNTHMDTWSRSWDRTNFNWIMIPCSQHWPLNNEWKDLRTNPLFAAPKCIAKLQNHPVFLVLIV